MPAFADRHPKQVRCFRFGKSADGREMMVLAANMQGVLTPEAAQAAKLPVTLIQGGIHAGEIDGKDAGFLVLRELLERQGRKAIRSINRCCCSCRCSTSTATSASAPGTAPTSAARRKWAGAPPPRTTT